MFSSAGAIMYWNEMIRNNKNVIHMHVDNLAEKEVQEDIIV